MLGKSPSKQDFDEFYSKENPWGFDGSLQDLVRQRIIVEAVGGQKEFENRIDVACG